MDQLEKLARKDAMRTEYRRRSAILQKHGLISNTCLVTSRFGEPCGMLPAVSEDDRGEIVFYHNGCCSEVHYKLYCDLSVDCDALKLKKAERAVLEVVNQFSDKISLLIKQYGKEEVYGLLNITIK